LPRMSFAGPLNPGLLSNLELRPVNYDAYALHQEFQRQRAEARRLKMNPILSFQATTGYRPLAFKGRSSAEEQSQRELLENLTAKLSSMTPLRSAQLRDLACPQMFADSEKRNSLVDRCRFHPNLLSLRVLTFVERLNSTRPKLVFIHPPDTLQMNMAFQMTDATTESVGYNLRAGLSLSPGNPLGLDILGQGRLGFNISMNGDMSWGRVVQKQNSQGVVINRSRSVTAEGVTYEIQAATRRCLILSPSEFALQNFPNQAKGLFFCSRNLNPQDRRQETYYLVNSQVGREGSVVVDNASNDPETTAFWRMMIRGNELFRLFQAVAEKPIYSLLVSRPPAEQQLNEDFKRLYQEGPTQLIPGAFVEVGE